MNVFVSTTLLLTLVANGVLLALLLREQRSVLRMIFIGYVISIMGWTLTILLFLLLEQPLLSPWIFFFATTGLTAQLWFAKVFPENKMPRNPATYWSIALSALFLLAGFVPDTLFSAMYAKQGHIVSTNGSLSGLYALFIITYFCIPVYTLLRKARTTKELRTRIQLRYLSIGFSLFLFVSIATNIVLPIFFKIYFFNTIGPVFSLIFVATSFYIIWQHKFLNIRVIIERGLVYAFLLALGTGSYFGALTLLIQYGVQPTIATPFVAFALLLIGGAAIYGIERSFERANLLKRERAYAVTLEKQVAQRTAHLEALQEYQKRMTGDIAHALQTPLTVLTSAIDHIQETIAVPGEILDTARQSTERLSQLLYALLRLSRLEALPNETLEVISLSDTVSATAEYIETVCTEQGIVLDRNIEPDVRVRGDHQQLEEVLTNLLSNAVRYTAHAAQKNITITLKAHYDDVFLSVADTGTGIPAASVPHLFERFYRVPNNTEPGTGLGLAIVKRIIELHNGTITVESTEGAGTTFTVRLPRVTPDNT